jgi:hypothetical protein
MQQFCISKNVANNSVSSTPMKSTFPVTALTDAARGLAQQMTFWGHDVRHPAGNALVRFGMERSPSPGLTGTSCYSMTWESGRIDLHGAVASWMSFKNRPGCIFPRDTGRIQLWSERHPPVPGRDHGTGAPPDERWEAFLPFLRWLVAYETWVFSTLESAWRAETHRAIARLPKGKPWLPPPRALAWWNLALTGIPPRAQSLLSH